MATSYGRARLVTDDDRRYRAYVKQFILQRQNRRPIRPPRQRDIFGDQAENALRNWLAGRLALSERRILEYEERRGKRAAIKYRELDALVLDGRSAWVFEIKASRTAQSLRRAASQLQETRAILRLLYPHVYATILLVDTGIPTADEVAALMAGPEQPTRTPATLDGTIAAMTDIRRVADLDACGDDATAIDLLCFSVDDIIALVGAENLALDWEAHEEIEDFAPPVDAGPAYSTADDADDTDDNPLAAALRRAGLKGGQDR